MNQNAVPQGPSSPNAGRHQPPPGHGQGYGPKSGWEREVNEGQIWAYASYGSMFLGFPLFIIPFITKDNRFAMYHAKHAAVAYIEMIALTAIITAISFATCGLGVFTFPLIFLAWVPSIHGFIIAANGRMEEPALCFGLGERLFSGLQATPKPEYVDPSGARGSSHGQSTGYGAPAQSPSTEPELLDAEISSSTGYKPAGWDTK